MLLEILRAMLLAGLPVGLVTAALVTWSLRRGYIGAAGSVADVERGIKQLGKDQKAERKRRKAAKRKPDGTLEGLSVAPGRGLDPVQRKWLAFGGGFYGVVALITYAVIELGDLRDFFLGFESLADLFRRFGFDMLVGLLVEAVVNFVRAIAWPVYWLSDIRTGHPWAWFLAAYAGYWAGARLAVRHAASAEG